jgi:hypothetical protein
MAALLKRNIASQYSATTGNNVANISVNDRSPFIDDECTLKYI